VSIANGITGVFLFWITFRLYTIHCTGYWISID
jgi:hypothetical protein